MISNKVKSLYALVFTCFTCQDRLQPYKMTEKQITEVFAWLDQRRRNFVDVSDFYAKFPDLSEAELFYIFKYLDISRRGSFTCQDLLQVLLNKCQNNREILQDSNRNFTNFIKILKATFHLTQQQKRRSNLTMTSVQQIFNRLTQGKKDKIDISDLLNSFQELGLDANENFMAYLKAKLFIKDRLNLKEFCTAFSQYIPSQVGEKSLSTPISQSKQISQLSANMQSKAAEKAKNSEKINKEIEKILQKYKNPHNEQMERYESKSSQIPQIQARKTFLSKLTTQQVPSSFSFQQARIDRNISDERVQRPSDYETSKIDRFLNAMSPQGSYQISRRREELKKGSIQRQRIIDDIMNRKKFESSGSKLSGTYSSSLRLQNFANQTQNFQPEIKKPSTPSSVYAHHLRDQFDRGTQIGMIYQRPGLNVQQSIPFARSASSANKPGLNSSSTGFYDRTSYAKLASYDQCAKPELSQFYRRAQTPKNSGYEKENILRKAEQEATRKIQEIERRARLKVMQKRSTTGIYSRWLK